MARFKVRLDSLGIEAMLTSAAVASVIGSVAESVAASIDEVAHDGPVPVDVYSSTSDRARAHVTMAHPGGLGIEATRSPLARAAAGAGLQVTSYGGS